MRGTLQGCFEISGRGVAAVLAKDDGDLHVGDWLVTENARWRIVGIDMPNYFGRSPPPEHIRNSVGFLLEGAVKADLLPLIGKSFWTEVSSAGTRSP